MLVVCMLAVKKNRLVVVVHVFGGHFILFKGGVAFAARVAKAGALVPYVSKLTASVPRWALFYSMFAVKKRHILVTLLATQNSGPFRAERIKPWWKGTAV